MNEERKGIETNLHGWRMRQMQSEKDMYFLNKRKAEIDSMIEVWTERLAEYIENKTNGTVIEIVVRQENPHFTFWYHVNNLKYVDGHGKLNVDRIQEALTEALQQRQEEIISQLEDWNNIEGINSDEVIRRLKEMLTN